MSKFPAKHRPGQADARRCAVLAAGLIAAICGLHVYWALGVGWARGLPDGVLNMGAWVIAGAFWLGVLENLGTGDEWSTAVSAPVSALLAALATVVATCRADQTRLHASGHLPRGA